MSEQRATKNDFDLSAVTNLAASLTEAAELSGEQVLTIDPAKTRDNPYQPRTERDSQADAELTESVKRHGVQQPIVVLPPDAEGIRTVVFGHRRRDAARDTGRECPAIERQYDDEQLHIFALIENLQRDDMTAKDEVAAVADLAHHFGTKQAAELLGRRSQYVSKIVKISKSAAPIRDLLATGYSADIAAFYELSVLHGKDQQAAEKIIARWNTEPEQRVSLRNQVAEAKAKLSEKNTEKEAGGAGSSKPSPKEKTKGSPAKSTSMRLEPETFHVEKHATGGVTLTLNVGDGATVDVTFNQAKWSEFLNAVNS